MDGEHRGAKRRRSGLPPPARPRTRKTRCRLLPRAQEGVLEGFAPKKAWHLSCTFFKVDDPFWMRFSRLPLLGFSSVGDRAPNLLRPGLELELGMLAWESSVGGSAISSWACIYGGAARAPAGLLWICSLRRRVGGRQYTCHGFRLGYPRPLLLCATGRCGSTSKSCSFRKSTLFEELQ